MAVWPTSLQQLLNQSDFSSQFEDTTISTEMDYGPVKKRRRYTDAVENIQCSIHLKNTDYETLQDFYRTELSGGVLPFDFVHPISQAVVKARFKGPYSTTVLGGIYFYVSMSWEFLP